MLTDVLQKEDSEGYALRGRSHAGAAFSLKC